MTRLWPDIPLPDPHPHEVEQRAETAYRVLAYRAERHKQLGMADAEHVDAFVAAERAALRGWRIEAVPEPFVRLVSGATNDLRPTNGRGGNEE